MDSKSFHRVMRSASPTTKERLRDTLSHYANVLDARIASMRELAVKEQVLQSRCGFTPVRGSGQANLHQKKPIADGASNAPPVATPSSKRPTPAAHRYPATDSSASARPVSCSESRSVRETHFGSVAVHVAAPAPPASPKHNPVERERVSPPPPPQQRHHSGDAAKDVLSVEPDELFAAASHQVTTLLSAAKRRRLGVPTAAKPYNATSGVASSEHGGISDTATLQNALEQERDLNVALRARILQRIIDSQSRIRRNGANNLLEIRPTSPLVDHSGQARPCLCAECAVFCEAQVERTLRGVFHRLQALHEEDDNDELGLARDEVAVLRMRRVELLAERIHWQRWLCCNRVVSAALPGFDHSRHSAASGDAQLRDQQRRSSWPSSHMSLENCVLDSLDALTDVATLHATLAARHAAANEAMRTLSASQQYLGTLSMLSELLWFVADATQSTPTR